jgi:hypothetical protein
MSLSRFLRFQIESSDWRGGAGWLLVLAMTTALARPPALLDRPLVVIYTLTRLTEAIGLVLFWQLYGPALSGFIAMGAFVLPALRKNWQTANRRLLFAICDLPFADSR